MTRAAQVAQRSGGAEHTRNARNERRGRDHEGYPVNKYKSPMQAGGAAEPTVGDHDVLVDIHAAGVNLLDAKIRDGEFKLLIAYKPPFTLRHDQAGVVTRVGSGGHALHRGRPGLRATARPPHRHLRRAHRRPRGRSRDQARETLHGRGGLDAPQSAGRVPPRYLGRAREALRGPANGGAAPTAAMLDPFSLGSARKWSAEPLRNKKTAL